MARIYIGVGSNIEPERHVRAGVRALGQVFLQLRCSAVYESQAVGFDGEDFYNLVVEAVTDLPLEGVLGRLKGIELAHGRAADARKFSSRTLDLDLLSYDGLVLAEPVVLPRPEILTNAFVLRPFTELAPDWRHPLAGQSLTKLWQAYDAAQQPLRRVELALWPVDNVGPADSLAG